MNTIEDKPVTRRELREIMKELFAANNEELRKVIKIDIDSAVNELALVVNDSFIEQREYLEGMNQRIIGINSRIDDIAENYTRKSEHGKWVKRVEKLEAVGLH